MFSCPRTELPRANSVRKMIFLLSLILFLSIGFVSPVEGNGEDLSIKATFETRIELKNGTLRLRFSSKEREMKLDFVLESKELHQTISSQEKLGVFVKVNGNRVDLSLEFLKAPGIWNPEARLDNNTYQTRASFLQEPGWKIVVVEKVKVETASKEKFAFGVSSLTLTESRTC